MPYTVYEFYTKSEIDRSWLISIFSDYNFEGFEETSDALKGYVPSDKITAEKVQQVLTTNEFDKLKFTWQQLEDKNWNEEWEKNYQPIEVAGKIRVRASYHEPNPAFQYEIVIDPKMSFGTGHHETTTLVMEQQLSLDHQGKSLLDVGSGTGILAILGEMLGATKLTAFDIEEWAYLNAVENAEMNSCKYTTVFQGTIEDCPYDTYDIVLANINRNILLREIPIYETFLKAGGTMMVSGFYEFDIEDITQKAEEVGLKLVAQKTLNQWVTLRFEKP